MCPFKLLSELVLKCDTGINLSESCCGGVELPLMEIFGCVLISSQALCGVMVEPDFVNIPMLLVYGGGMPSG